MHVNRTSFIIKQCTLTTYYIYINGQNNHIVMYTLHRFKSPSQEKKEKKLQPKEIVTQWNKIPK